MASDEAEAWRLLQSSNLSIIYLSQAMQTTLLLECSSLLICQDSPEAAFAYGVSLSMNIYVVRCEPSEMCTDACMLRQGGPSKVDAFVHPPL